MKIRANPWLDSSIPATRAAIAAISRAALGCANSRAAWLICSQALRILQQRRDRLGQPDSFQFRLFDHHRGSVPRQSFGIDALMIVGRARERNEDGRLPCRRNFRDRARARAAHHQIGARKGRRHVFDELEDFGRLAQRLISRQRVIIVTLARSGE